MVPRRSAWLFALNHDRIALRRSGSVWQTFVLLPMVCLLIVPATTGSSAVLAAGLGSPKVVRAHLAVQTDEDGSVLIDEQEGTYQAVEPLDGELDLPPGVEPIYIDEELPLPDETYGMKPQFVVPYPGSYAAGAGGCGCGDVCQECGPGYGYGGVGCSPRYPGCGLGCLGGLFSGLGSTSQCDCPRCRQAYGGAYRGTGFSAAVDLMLLRLHIIEDSFNGGKFSEKYEFSPRVVIRYDNRSGYGGRIRYWHYGYLTDDLSGGPGVRFEFDVLDLEAFGRIESRRTSFEYGGGLRLANVDSSGDSFDVELDALGVTIAADGRTILCCHGLAEWTWLYGARLSILGGDWDGTFQGAPAPRDDNLLVHEFYVGVGQRRRFRNLVFDLDLTVESQNWHSDFFSQNADTDSVGFIGPRLRIGASF